jgi:Zn-dependent M28 family amino/carboxypeptidase
MRHPIGLGLVSAVAVGSMAVAAGSGPIDPKQMSDTVKVLASDSFEGRAPGTPGEARTVAYLIQRFKALGLQPGGEGGSWTQSVPLVRTQVQAPAILTFKDAKGSLTLRQGEEISVVTVRPVDRVRIKDTPLVFVGYGVHAPERGWDDFKGVDLRGKIAVFLVNDPDFEAGPGEPVAGKFGGKAMTYYGRWTYKYEEAARRGAIGALIVHDAPGAGYGWSTVVAPGGEAYDVVRAPGSTPPVALQGWIRGDAAHDLFRRAGLDLDALRIKARRADFHPVALGGLRFDADVPVRFTRVQSHNVLAKLPGTLHPDETVMFAAHWDAYGIGKPDATGDRIHRGANDDGLGIAGVLEIARAFTRAPRPQRTVVFAAWTAEERGLLGSETYASRPIYPLAKTVGNFTMDILETAGPSHDVVLIGAGQDSLEGDLARAAAAQGRHTTPDSHPERGLFYRADHFSLAKRGVPTVLLMAIGGGPDLVNGGRAAGDKWVSDYTAHCYHQPCDAWSPSWDLRGAAQDVDLVYEAGSALVNSRAWPAWIAGSEFKATRDKSAEQRK